MKSRLGQNLQADVLAGNVFPVWIRQKGKSKSGGGGCSLCRKDEDA